MMSEMLWAHLILLLS